jgi:alpha-1,2-mannosyltransferase
MGVARGPDRVVSAQAEGMALAALRRPHTSRGWTCNVGLRRRALELGVFAELPALFLVVVAWASAHTEGNDFRVFRKAGMAVLHGHSPYVEPSAALLSASDKFVYPAPFALPFAPFALIPVEIANTVFFTCAVAALIAALRIVGVRDYRCYGLTVVTAPAFLALGTGALEPFFVLLLALAWRDRLRGRSGVYLALVAAAKLFLWPILLWPLVLGRFRTFASAVATAIALIACWALLAPHQLSMYLQTVRVLNSVQRTRSYSPQSLALALGAPTVVATGVALAIAVVGAGLVVLAGRSRHRDRKVFSAVIAVALFASPILWEHYLVLLLLPIALAQPKLGRIWVATLLFWVSPDMKAFGSEWRIVVTLTLSAAIVVAAARRLSATSSSTAGTALRGWTSRDRRAAPRAGTAADTSAWDP